MQKLIQLSIATAIGLSLFSCDPEETFENHYYEVYFKNETSKEIKLITKSLISNPDGVGFIKQSNSLDIPTDNRSPSDYFTSPSHSSEVNNSNLIIKTNVNGLLYIIEGTPTSSFELYVDGELIKEWNPPAGSLGNNINSPYNYDSWDLVIYDKVLNPSGSGNFIYGEIIFTITDEDIE